MERALGIGGVFVRAREPTALADWYAAHLGIEVMDPEGNGVALNFMYTNFARPMKVLANPYPRTPAMEAGVADHVWTCEEIAALLD